MKTTPSSPPTVILLHGLCRSARSMRKMEAALRSAGYGVLNVNYPSRTAPIEELADLVFPPLEKIFSGGAAVHFVTHSMGAVLLRCYLQQHRLPAPGRIVMLAPPSRGSELPDRLGRFKLYQWINGPAGNQLGTGPGSLPLRLKNPERETGVIAGDRSLNPFLSLFIPGPNDGKVSVARARPEGAADFIRLHVTHTCMMRNLRVIEQTIMFLETGAFQKGEAS